MEDSDCIFSKHTEQKRSFFRLVKENSRTILEVDQTRFTHSSSINQNEVKRNVQQNGFCIRTGVIIPFDLSRPFSKEAYYSWANFSNPNYPEKFCHYSGEPSKGKTTFDSPCLEKYEKEAFVLHNKLHRY